MPMLNVHVSDDLAARVLASGISVSTICQRALEAGVREAEERQGRPGTPRERSRRDPVDHRPDDLARESAGYESGLRWATRVARSHELAALANADPAAGHAVSRDRGELYDLLAGAGLPADSETNRVLGADDPWARGFLRACRESWREAEPLM